jgi:cation diffusion facilitator family transporter
VSTDQALPQPELNRALAERTSLYSVGVNLLLVALKYSFALLSGSVALMADAIHSMSDVFASLTVVAGLKISRRKSRDFPYGLYKVENLVSLGIAFVILLVAYELARDAVLGEISGELAQIPATIAAVVAVVFITLGFSRYEGAVARRTGSPALEADSEHVFVDTLSACAVLASLIGGAFGLNLDLWATLIIVLFIARTGAHLVIGAIRVLLDASVERELLNDIERVLRDDPNVVEVRDLKGRNSGSYRFIEATVVLNVHDLEQAHDISRRLEQAVGEAARNVDEVLIHYEPVQKDEYIYAVPIGEGQAISEHFGEAQRFALVTVGTEDKLVRGTRLVDNPYARLNAGRGIKVAEMLVQEGVDAVLAREDLHGRGPYYVLSDARVRVAQTNAGALPEALRAENVREGSSHG